MKKQTTKKDKTSKKKDKVRIFIRDCMNSFPEDFDSIAQLSVKNTGEILKSWFTDDIIKDELKLYLDNILKSKSKAIKAAKKKVKKEKTVKIKKERIKKEEAAKIKPVKETKKKTKTAVSEIK